MKRRYLTLLFPLALLLILVARRSDEPVHVSQETSAITTQPLVPPTDSLARASDDSNMGALRKAFAQGETIEITFQGEDARRYLFRKRQAVAQDFQLTVGSSHQGRIETNIASYEGWPVHGMGPSSSASVVFVNDTVGGIFRDQDGSIRYVRTHPETGVLEFRLEEPGDIQLSCAKDERGVFTMKRPGGSKGSDWHGGHTVKITPVPAGLSGFDPATGELDRYVNPISLGSLYDASLPDAMLLLVLDKEATGNDSEANLASKASQYLATVANVASVYENQLGIRLLVQELVMIPDSPSYTDIPSRDDVDDFLDWCDRYRPIETYGWSMASKFGAGLDEDTLGVAYVDTVGEESAVSVCAPDGAWDVLAHEMGHNLGSGHSDGGIMNATSDGGQERTFFTNVSRNESAAKDIYDYSRNRLLGSTLLRHPEEIPFAQNDRITTSVNTPVTFAPLNNDDTAVLNGATNTLTLTELGAITPKGAGSAEIVGSDVLFTPATDFEGTVWFSYTIRGSVGSGWLHKADVAVIVGMPVDPDEITLPAGGSFSFKVSSVNGLTQPQQARVDVSRDDAGLLIVRANADALGIDSFRAGSRTYTITYTSAAPLTRPDVFVYDGVSSEFTFNPTLNDEGAGERWLYPINPTIGTGTSGASQTGRQFFPTAFRLVSAENLTPEMGELIMNTRPVTVNGRRTDIVDERLTFIPNEGVTGNARIEYVVEDATGRQAVESAEILMPYSVDQLVSTASSVRVRIPDGPGEDAVWMQPGYDDSSWRRGSNGVGYEGGTGYQSLIETDVEEMRRNVSSAFIRIPFQLEDADSYQRLALKMRYDDGFVAYLNGVEVARANAAGASPLAWNETASASHPDAQARELTSFDITERLDLIVSGENFLAIHGLNFTANSSDFLILPELTGITVSEVRSEPEPAPELWSLTIETAPSEGGTVSGAGTYQEGESTTITVVPSDGFRFVRWEGEGISAPTESTATILMTENRSVIAVLEEIPLDGDSDGILDDWEREHGLNPNDRSDAIADTDHDGFSNYSEFIAMTDPQDGASSLRILRMVPRGITGLTIHWASVPDVVYRLESSLNLTHASWQTITEVSASGSEASAFISREDSPRNRYFRISVRETP